mmetsp:Transcript_5865/g.8244  ORF Transcript_5865/g.8244 Transcript_5865/m.8244 type:complete len:189 (-) Transcript_5865:7-573(-)
MLRQSQPPARNKGTEGRRCTSSKASKVSRGAPQQRDLRDASDIARSVRHTANDVLAAALLDARLECVTDERPSRWQLLYGSRSALENCIINEAPERQQEEAYPLVSSVELEEVMSRLRARAETIQLPTADGNAGGEEVPDPDVECSRLADACLQACGHKSHIDVTNADVAYAGQAELSLRLDAGYVPR